MYHSFIVITDFEEYRVQVHHNASAILYSNNLRWHVITQYDCIQSSFQF